MSSKRRTSASQPKAPAPALQPRRELLDNAFFYLLPVLLFLTMTAVSSPYAIGITVVFLVFSIGKGPLETLRGRLSPLTLAVFLYAALCLVSGLWSHFGRYALRETIKTLAALSFFGLVDDAAEKGASALAAELSGGLYGCHRPALHRRLRLPAAGPRLLRPDGAVRLLLSPLLHGV